MYVITSEGKFEFELDGERLKFKLEDFEKTFCKIYDIEYCGDEDIQVCIDELNDDVISICQEAGYWFVKIQLDDSTPEYVVFDKDVPKTY